MARKDDIAADAVADVGTNYHWASFGNAGGIPAWLEGGAAGAIGTTADHAISCFDLPLLLAIRRNYVTRPLVTAMYHSIMDNRMEQGFSSRTSWRGLGWLLSNWTWRDWPNPLCIPTNAWRPRRGDLVFLNEPGGGNHVVLSLGPNPAGAIEVVSFGEGMVAAGQTTVNRLTLAQIRATYANVNRVTFMDPAWS